tara:strand:- start:426 stop:938 length:513 start_codon:yes stop_codon:yes gene_type:complete
MAFKLNKDNFNFGEGTRGYNSPNKIVKHLGKAIPGLNAAVIGYEVYKHATRDKTIKKLSDYDWHGNKKVEAIFRSRFPEKYKEAQRLEKEYQEKQNPDKNVAENIKDNKAGNKNLNKNNKTTKLTGYDKAYKNRDMKVYGNMSKAEYIKEAKRQKAVYDKTGKWDVKKNY